LPCHHQKGSSNHCPSMTLAWSFLGFSMTQTPAFTFAPTSSVSGLSVFSRSVTPELPECTPPPGPPPESGSAWPPVAETAGTPTAQWHGCRRTQTQILEPAPACTGARGAPEERRSATARLISSGLVRSRLVEFGPSAWDYGNGNLERAYYNQGFTGIEPQRRREHGGRTTETTICLE